MLELIADEGQHFVFCIFQFAQDGGFYSAEDADSFPKLGDKHKKEGAFCVWEERDLRNLLAERLPGQPDVTVADVFIHHFGVKPKGNASPSQVCMQCSTDMTAKIPI